MQTWKPWQQFSILASMAACLMHLPGCSDPVPPNPAPSALSRVQVSSVAEAKKSVFADLPADQQAELEALSDGRSDEVDLRLATPPVEDLQRMPISPQVKSVTIRKLKVSREHLEALTRCCPNLETLHVFSAVVVPDLLNPLRDLKSLHSLRVGDRDLNDESLEPLRNLPLKELTISTTSVTDGGMEVVGTLTSLETLYLHDLPVTDAGVAKLSNLMQLRWLTLGATEITDAALQTVAGMKELRLLSLNGTRITDTGLKELALLEHMDWFEADGSFFRGPEHSPRITDQGLRVIAEWPAIATVSLWRTPITNDGLATLGRVKTLRNLSIGETAVTDDGLPHLYQLPLKNLNLSGTETTPEAIEKIKQAIPGLKVSKFGQLQ